jgi:hypothetical protein
MLLFLFFLYRHGVDTELKVYTSVQLKETIVLIQMASPIVRGRSQLN